jgi:hypothetical protein
MHRYDENTIGNMRIDYLHRMERVYESEITRMQDAIENSSNAREVTTPLNARKNFRNRLRSVRNMMKRLPTLLLPVFQLIWMTV